MALPHPVADAQQKVRSRELGEAGARRILSVFQVHLADGYYRLISMEPREYQVARTWLGSFRTPLRTLDAFHCSILGQQPLQQRPG